jgi:uncharacterized Zn finger protein
MMRTEITRCSGCGSNDTSVWYHEGDSGFECNNCGRVVENNVLIRKGDKNCKTN